MNDKQKFMLSAKKAGLLIESTQRMYVGQLVYNSYFNKILIVIEISGNSYVACESLISPKHYLTICSFNTYIAASKLNEH